MADERNPLSPTAAAALLGGGAAAAGPCPADPLGAEAWRGRVAGFALDLARLIPQVVEAGGRAADADPVSGVIVSVEERSGRGVIHIRPTMGNDQAKLEDFRTPWLNEPRGRAMHQLAKALTGRHCRFGKVIDVVPGSGKKVRMCEWIDDLGPDPTASRPTSVPAAATTPGPDAPPVARGYVSLRSMRPATLEELWDMANTHLNIGADVVEATAQRKWAWGDGTVVTADLKPNQLLILWNQLINDHHGRVAA